MRRLGLPLMAIVAFAVFLAACSGDEVIVEKIVTVEVVKTVEVVVEKIETVEKIVEVEKIVIATPTPPPAGTAQFGGTLRIVSQASVATLDPYWTQAYVTAAVASHLFEQPFGWDSGLNEKPQMVDTWSISSDSLTYTFTLRSGLLFHDGTRVTADDVVTSFTRWLGGQDAAAGLMRDFVADPSFSVVDDLTFNVNLTEPFGAVTDGMARPWSGVSVMPTRIVNVPSSTAVEEWIGSSPYKFASWEPGYQIILERFDDYKVDSRPADGYTGARVAYADRLIWLEVPDEETKIAGLETGEWDVVDGAGLDFFDRLDKNPDITVPLYKPGHRAAIGLIPTHPPFDDLVLRNAVQTGLDYEALMASLGDSRLWELNASYFYAGTPWESDAGAEFYNINDQDLARELVQQSDYAGEEIVYLNPTDYATITPIGIVAKQQLQGIGINVNQPAHDWATVVTMLGDPDAFDAWGSWGVHWCCGDPIRSSIFGGDQAFWPRLPKIQRLRREYAQEVDFAKRKALIDQIQIEGYKAVLWVEPGVFFSIYPHTADYKNFEVKAMPYYINAWLTR